MNNLDLTQPVQFQYDREVPILVSPDFNGEIVWFCERYGFFSTNMNGSGEANRGRYVDHVKIVNGVSDE